MAVAVTAVAAEIGVGAIGVSGSFNRQFVNAA